MHFSEAESGRLIMLHRSIICWALVEKVGGVNGGLMEVRGMEQGADDGLTIVDDSVAAEGNSARRSGNYYFLGYDDPNAHHESEYWIAQANRRLRNDKEHPEP